MSSDYITTTITTTVTTVTTTTTTVITITITTTTITTTNTAVFFTWICVFPLYAEVRMNSRNKTWQILNIFNFLPLNRMDPEYFYFISSLGTGPPHFLKGIWTFSTHWRDILRIVVVHIQERTNVWQLLFHINIRHNISVLFSVTPMRWPRFFFNLFLSMWRQHSYSLMTGPVTHHNTNKTKVWG